MTGLPPASEVDPEKFAVFDDEWAKARMELARDGVARARTSAEIVQKSAAAFGVLYSGLLGLVYSVSERPLNPNALVPAIFLGLAVFLPVTYLAYVGRVDRRSEWDAIKVRAPRRWAQMNAFVDEANLLIARRSAWLRAGVVSLGVAIVLLPLPFLSQQGAGDEPPPAWPEPPTVVDAAQAELIQARYEAELAEVAADRAAVAENAPRTTEPLPLAYGVAGLIAGLAAVVVIPRVSRRSAP